MLLLKVKVTLNHFHFFKDVSTSRIDVCNMDAPPEIPAPPVPASPPHDTRKPVGSTKDSDVKQHRHSTISLDTQPPPSQQWQTGGQGKGTSSRSVDSALPMPKSLGPPGKRTATRTQSHRRPAPEPSNAPLEVISDRPLVSKSAPEVAPAPSSTNSNKSSGGSSSKPSGGSSSKPSGGSSSKAFGGSSGKPFGGSSSKPSGGSADAASCYENVPAENMQLLVGEGYRKDMVLKALNISRNDLTIAREILREFSSQNAKT